MISIDSGQCFGLLKQQIQSSGTLWWKRIVRLPHPLRTLETFDFSDIEAEFSGPRFETLRTNFKRIHQKVSLGDSKLWLPQGLGHTLDATQLEESRRWL